MFLSKCPVRGKEALPVILIQISSRTGGNRQLFRMAECTKMDSQRLPLQLLLLVLTVAPGLDAHPGTTVTPRDANVSSEATVNATVLNQTVETLENTEKIVLTIDQNYSKSAEKCWNSFVYQMANISEANWCEWRAIQRPYGGLRLCLEHWADKMKYSYPNAFAENYTVSSHHIYFHNCIEFLDPPESILLPLIITPICLIPFLVTLVVLKSKDGKMQS
ncbi:receptor activity-modifying protein 2 [Hemicordylus capensis]|uniref:receptor activity-modifying protein 2 n=1 Tax=Hemicordylus capensis TaxID=884348 RepID=UPI0023025259|nr:receptor activity-modifying protein 2 [Hemicordylus capensis]